MHHHPRSSRCLARSGNCFGDDRPRRTAPPRVCPIRHDAVLSVSRRPLPASRWLRFRFARRADFHLVINCANSALWFYETCRHPRTARVHLSMAASAIKTKADKNCYLCRPCEPAKRLSSLLVIPCPAWSLPVFAVTASLSLVCFQSPI